MLQQISEKEREAAESISVRGFNVFVGPLFRLPPGEEKDLYRFFFRAEEKHMNAGRTVHGGMLMTLMDVAMGQSARLCSGATASATVSLNCNFVGPGKLGDTVDAQVRIVRKTRNFVFMQGELYAGDRVLFSASGMWKIFT